MKNKIIVGSAIIISIVATAFVSFSLAKKDNSEKDFVAKIQSGEPDLNVCLNIEGVQTRTPEGMSIENNNCIVEIVKETREESTVYIYKEAPKTQPDNVSPAVEENNPPVQPVLGPQRTFNTDGTLDLTVYQEITLIEYIKNSKKYLNKPIKIKGGVVAGFHQYSNSGNYITIIDQADYSEDPESVTVEIESDDHYSILVEEVEQWGNVLIYAFGAADEEFTIVGGENGSYLDTVKKIVSDSIYKCTTNCTYTYNVGTKLVFSKKYN